MRHQVLQKINLKTRLIGGLLMMGLLVFAVAWLGWSSTSQLSKHINVITLDTLSIGCISYLTFNLLKFILWVWEN